MKPRTDEHAAPQSASDWRALRILMPYLWTWRGRVMLAMLLLAAAKGANVVLPIVLKYIVDGFSEANAVVVVPIALLIAYGLLRLASVLFGELRDVVFGRVTERSMHQVALEVFKHLHSLDLSFHLDRRTGGLSRDIERGLAGISFLLRFMLFNIVPTLLEITLVAVILGIGYSIWYAVITLVAVVLYIGFSVAATEWRTAFVREANRLDSKANTRAVDALLNYETVKYFNNEQYEAENYDRALDNWEAAIRKNRLSLGSLNSGQALIISIAMTTMMIMAATDVAAGRMTVGDLVLINAYMLQLFMPLNFLGFVYREIKRSLADMNRMFKLLDVDSSLPDRDDKPLQITGPRIEFQSINFHYHADRQILNNVNFTIEPGQKVAVVGASGAGKSTLARLLFRFYDASSGSITIDGQDIRNVSQHSLRSAIGVVPQDTVLFNDTIRYNIRYGKPEASDAEIERATKLAHLDGFLARLPDGWDTMVGERGLKVSGGEKQRIAIARAILKDPPIMIFDEATSSLDSASEKAILGALNEVAQQRTTLVIAHRLSTIVDADRIVVLDHGEVVETGNHQELINAAGRYAELWRLQQHEQKEPDNPNAVVEQTINEPAPI